MSVDPNAPVIVAVAQQTWREADNARTPLDALHAVAGQALGDSGCEDLLASIDAVATVRFLTDSNPDLIPLMPRNPGLLLARRLGISRAQFFQTTLGGNTPQYLVNHFAGRIAGGEFNAVLISGAELMNTFLSALRSGGDISNWAGEATAGPILLGEERDGVNALERAHGLYEPVNTYPVFENALQHHLGRSREEQQAMMAQICAGMSDVAAENPLAWKPSSRTAGDIGQATEKNRYIGYPYTKAMNAILMVDMAAAIVMTTAGKARELGIAPERIIYLRSGVDLNEVWHVSEREHLHTAPAIGLAVRAALQQAQLALEDIDLFDLYSCFPSAVEIACNEIGLSPLDPRGVTVTGGLPFFGGPGNCYTLHAIAETVSKLRGRKNTHALVTGNGFYLTKHAAGIYSTEAPPVPFETLDAVSLQQIIDAQPKAPVAENFSGQITVESYTVAFGRSGPERGIVVGRNAAGERVLANSTDATTINQLLQQDPLGRTGRVTQATEFNRFEFQ
jgi:acetyl-CoA C-acetyltransferase